MNGELDDAIADDDRQESSSPDTLLDVLTRPGLSYTQITGIAYNGADALNSKRIQRGD